MSEFARPPRRAPRKKLKMPLFGNMGSSSSEGNTDWGVKNFSTLVFVVGTLGLLAQLFLPSLWSEKVYDSESEIKELRLDGALRKKYTDASDPNEIHYLLVIKQKDGTRRKIDLFDAKTNFFDQVAVPQRLYKETGSMDVRVTRFSKPDTLLRIEFLKN
jgi:hypothetical protein